VVSFTPRPLYSQGKSPWYPLDRRPGGPQSRSGRGGEEKSTPLKFQTTINVVYLTTYCEKFSDRHDDTNMSQQKGGGGLMSLVLALILICTFKLNRYSSVN
jgi:hypothetical protein